MEQTTLAANPRHDIVLASAEIVLAVLVLASLMINRFDENGYGKIDEHVAWKTQSVHHIRGLETLGWICSCWSIDVVEVAYSTNF
jgi:hypothetical protein